MDEAKDLIKKDLGHAGEDTRVQALRERMEKRLITDKTVIPKMCFLFQMFGFPCFPRGELVAITGKAKSGKTFVSSLLMALCFRQEVMGVRRIDSRRAAEYPEDGEMSPLRVLWIDTEQSEESTQDILVNRIMPMVGGGLEEGAGDVAGRVSTGGGSLFGYFKIYNLRIEPWQYRLPMVEIATEDLRPDLVIVDGIRDLVDDINDGVMAQNVIERLMGLASRTGCCMTCILHQNKSVEDKNLRGWIGTELMNKAFEVYECKKDENRVFTLSQISTRKYDIVQDLRYVVEGNGIPQLYTGQFVAVGQIGSQSRYPPINPVYMIDEVGEVNVEKLFSDVFRSGESSKSDSELQAAVMGLSNINSTRYYNTCLRKALRLGVVSSLRDVDGNLFYTRGVTGAPVEQSLDFPEVSSGSTDVPY